MPGPFEKLTQIYLRGPEALRLSPNERNWSPDGKISVEWGRLSATACQPASVCLVLEAHTVETSGPLSYREGNCL